MKNPPLMERARAHAEAAEAILHRLSPAMSGIMTVTAGQEMAQANVHATLALYYFHAAEVWT